MKKHAIIVIKNNKNEYLQYFDENWDSYLFMNCKMKDKNDMEEIMKKINESLLVDKENIKCHFIGEKMHKKFSERSKIEKEYEHYFYKVELFNELEKISEKEFNILNKNYKWFSLCELKNDERIQKVNSDILEYIEEFNM